MRTKRLTLQQRKEIFAALVTAQDDRMGVTESKQLVISNFKISDVQLRQIEEEGIEKEWPPLNQAPVVRELAAV